MSKFIKKRRARKLFREEKKDLLLQQEDNMDFEWDKDYPILNEKEENANAQQIHYFYQDIHVAQLIHKNNPERHVDIGSRIDGFVTHVAAYRPIEVFDIRPLTLDVHNLHFVQCDLLQLDNEYKDYCDSISSLHVIEHIGLGRYGDPLDYYGHLKAINTITSILRSGGTFYFSTPIGRQRIEFNAHRVFSVEYLCRIFEKDYDIVSFSYEDEDVNFHPNVKLNPEDIKNNFGVKDFGCGIFELRKK